MRPLASRPHRHWLTLTGYSGTCTSELSTPYSISFSWPTRTIQTLPPIPLYYDVLIIPRIVFKQIRGWNSGIGSLSFAGIGIGAMCTICSEPLLRKMVEAHKHDPKTGRPSPEAGISIICLAACLAPIGQLWFSWTCEPASIHWAIPIAAGIPFGCGTTMVLIYGSSYISGTYGLFAASAMVGNNLMKNVLGGFLPLAGPAMFGRLGPRWAGTVLGLLEVVLIPIPFVFYFKGAAIRNRSPVVAKLKELQLPAKPDVSAEEPVRLNIPHQTAIAQPNFHPDCLRNHEASTRCRCHRCRKGG